ncbi:MAG: FecR domain-containing protein [Deltaproteobacteria bacterium]|nr:FecR domain-containing protein [Deltaproteobacteria bacterium]
MKTARDISRYAVCVLVVLCAWFGCSPAVASGIPADLAIESPFRPGPGAPVGSVLLVQGTAVVVHGSEAIGYLLKSEAPLFKGDTLMTDDEARVRFRLNDGSELTLSSGTRLTINKSVYDPDSASRSSFIGMSFGKARFLVTNLAGARQSEFRVKTQTAVCGVRGSDFVLNASPVNTEVTALENTRLEVASLSFPGVEPVLVSDYERTQVQKGALPSEVVRVSPEEIEQLLEDFMVGPGEVEAGAVLTEVEKKAEERAAETGVETFFAEEELKGILFSGDEVVVPEYPAAPEIAEEPGVPEITVEEDIREQSEQMQLQQEVIFQEQLEDEVIQEILKEELPHIPGTPEL